MTHTIVQGYRIFDHLYTNKAEAVALEDGKDVAKHVTMIVHMDDVASIIPCELGEVFNTLEDAEAELLEY